MSDIKGAIKEIIDPFFQRFEYGDQWSEHSSLYFEAWKAAWSEALQNEVDISFENIMINKITDMLLDTQVITDYYDEAFRIVKQHHDELFDPESYLDEESCSDLNLAIAKMSEEEVIEIVIDILAENDSSSLKDVLIQANANVRVMFSPNFQGFDESRVYMRTFDDIDISDDAFVNALKFFGIKPSELHAMAIANGYDVDDSILSIPEFDDSSSTICTKNRAFTIIENASDRWIPAICFNIGIADLLHLQPGTEFLVNGGDLGAFDIYNGGGHSESLEPKCFAQIKVKNPSEFINFCDDTELAKTIIDGWAIYKGIYNVELSIN